MGFGLSVSYVRAERKIMDNGQWTTDKRSIEFNRDQAKPTDGINACFSFEKFFIREIRHSRDTTKFIPNPKQTLRYSLIPAGGQWYNRQKWKMPFVYAGLATTTGFYLYFRWQHDRYDAAYRYKVNAELKAQTGSAFREEDLNNADFKAIYDALSPNGTLPSSTLKTARNDATRNRQISALATGGVYALSIIEAYIAANLLDFDVSETASFHVLPTQKGITARLIIQF